jgi:hypothetical protein
MTLPNLARRVIRAYRGQLTKEDLARIETQFSALDRRLGIARSKLVGKHDPLEQLWRLPAASG